MARYLYETRIKNLPPLQRICEAMNLAVSQLQPE